MKMTGVIGATIFLCALTFTNVFCQGTGEGYAIICSFKGLPDKTKAYLTTQEKDTVQSVISSGNSFTFSGKLHPDGRFHFIKFDSTISKVTSRAVFVTNKPIVINGVLGQRNITVTGSPEQAEYNEFVQFSRDFSEAYNRIEDTTNIWANKRRRAQLESDSTSYRFYLAKAKESAERRRDLQRTYADKLKKWFYAHRNSIFVPWAIESCLMNSEFMGIEYTTESYNVLPDYVKNSYYGKKLTNSLNIAKTSLDISLGGTIPNIEVVDINGDTQQLHDVIKSSKFTLIDCWASWCTPCRAEIPELKKIFHTYKSAGLNIVGISSDMKPDKWKKAVKEDQTPWSHYLAIPSASIFRIFDLRSIPAYILVNENGVLVAFDRGASRIPPFGGSLRGDGLAETLESLLH